MGHSCTYVHTQVTDLPMTGPGAKSAPIAVPETVAEDVDEDRTSSDRASASALSDAPTAPWMADGTLSRTELAHKYDSGVD